MKISQELMKIQKEWLKVKDLIIVDQRVTLFIQDYINKQYQNKDLSKDINSKLLISNNKWLKIVAL
jgi:hypothetical protein